jgi:dethiobiotin synthetase
MPCYQENLETLQRLLRAPLLGEVPQLSPFDALEASSSLATGVFK